MSIHKLKDHVYEIDYCNPDNFRFGCKHCNKPFVYVLAANFHTCSEMMKAQAVTEGSEKVNLQVSHHGIRKQAKYTEADKAVVLFFVERGGSMRQAAEKFGIRKSTVDSWVRKHRKGEVK